MNINKKIDSYTLSEILVVLVISSIVVTLAFLSLSMVQKQLRIIQTNITSKQEIQFFERLLWKDFNEHTVRYLKKEDLFLLTSDVDSISYSFHDNYVLREKDTIKIEIVQKQLFLDGNKVNDGNIDAIKIETAPSYGNSRIFVYKPKDAAFYINN